MILALSQSLGDWILITSVDLLPIWIFWALCITPLLLGALAAGLRGAGKLFLGLMLLTLLAARLPLFCLDYLNPDEAFFASAAMRMSVDPVAYRAADPGTSGPLNIYVQALPAWAGSTITYASVRLVAILLMFGSLALLWLALRPFLGHVPAALSVMPMLCFLSYARESDFVHASSEHLPIFLCALTFWLLAWNYRSGPLSPLALDIAVGAVAASLVFAKMQALPFAASLLLLAAVVAWRKTRRWAAIAGLCGGAALVPLLFVAMFLRFGLLREFLTSFIERNFTYAEGGRLSEVGKFLQGWSMLWSHTSLKCYVLGLSAIWAAGLYACLATVRHEKTAGPSRGIVAFSAASLLLLLAGVAAVVEPGRPFPHYLLFLLVPFTLVTASSILWLQRLIGAHLKMPFAALFLMVACVFPAAAAASRIADPENAWDTPRFDRDRPLVTLIQRYAAPGEKLSVWGWQQELNVASQRIPGTRFSDTAPQLEEAPYQSYFRQLYLADFESARPAVFVDAVGLDGFYYHNRALQGYEVFEALRQRIESDYRQVAEMEGKRVFVRSDLLSPVAPPAASVGAR